MKFLLGRLATAVLLLSSVASAASIGVHNTGVNATDNLVATGASASFWILTLEPSGGSVPLGSTPSRYFNGSYFADTASAAWVSPVSGGNAGTLGNYTYTLTFDLTGFNPATALLAGNFGSDNSGVLRLNGNIITSVGSGAFGAPTAFTMNSGFVSGINTITVTVNNEGDPTAFFVQFTSNSVGVPEPGTMSLVGLGMVALGLVRKLRS